MLQFIRTEFKIVGSMVSVIFLTLLAWVTLIAYEAKDAHLQTIFIEQNNINIQRLPISARNYHDHYDNLSFKMLRKNTTEIERVVNVIGKGGILTYNHENYELQAAKSKVVRQQINTFLREFEVHKAQLKKIVANNLPEAQQEVSLQELRNRAEVALKYLSEKNERLLVLNSRIGSTARHFWEQQRRQMRFTIFVIAVLIFLLCGYAVYIFRSVYLRKLREIRQEIFLEMPMLKDKKEIRSDVLEGVKFAVSQIADGLKDATNFAKKIGEGDFGISLQTVMQDQQLGQALQEMRTKLIGFSEEEEQKTWFNRGIAETIDLLKDSRKDMEVLSMDFLRFIIKYLELNQGAVFVRNAKDVERFELTAHYAFDQKKFGKKTVRHGEGLIGQCIAEKSTMYTEKIPKNYMNITSGLGTAPPTVLLIVPIKEENKHIHGVLELASFTPIGLAHIRFVEDVCLRFGNFLTNAQTAFNTKELLQKTNLISEQLRHKEQEMQQHKEKLEQTKNKLNQKLKELRIETNLSRDILDAISQTHTVVEFDLNGNISEANQTFLDGMSFNKVQIAGINEYELVSKDQKTQTQAYKDLWEKLKKGDSVSGEYRRLTKFGREVWLKGTYNPIFNLEGKPYKIIQIAQFITAQKEKELDYNSKIEVISNSYPLVDLSLNGDILTSNATFSAYIESVNKNFKGRSFSSFLTTDYIETFRNTFSAVIKSKRPKSVLLKFYVRTEKYAIVTLNPIQNLSGKMHKVFLLIMDITDHKKLELSLVESKNTLSGTISELELVQQHLSQQKQELEIRMKMLEKATFIFEINAEKKFVAVSRSLCQKLDTTRTQLIKKPFTQIIHGSSSDKLEKLFLPFQEEGSISRKTLSYVSFEGNVWWGDTTIATMKTKASEQPHYLGIVFEVSEHLKQGRLLNDWMMVQKAKDDKLRTQKTLPLKPLEAIIEKLGLDERDAIDIDKVLTNNLAPVFLLNYQCNIDRLNPLGEGVFSAFAQKTPDLIGAPLSDWIETVNKQKLFEHLKKGILVEQKIFIKPKGQLVDDLAFEAAFIPVFARQKEDFKTLVILSKIS